MKLHHATCAGLLASVAFAAAAQQPPSRPDPRDPRAAVPSPTYHSAFASYLPAKDDTPTPDKAWIDANKEVRASGAHGGHMQHQMPAAESGVTASMDKPAPAPAADHSKHVAPKESK